MKTLAVLGLLLCGLAVGPTFAAASTLKAHETTYVVQPGDTLSAVAAAFHTTVAVLSAQNNIANPDLIFSGERLTIPTPAANLPPGSRAMVCTLTAYTDGYASTGKYPGEPGYGITSTGQQAKQGLSIAVDPSVIPYGTPVYIPGVGLRVADDTGGAITGSHIDVFYNREQTALNFGVKQHIIVYIIPRKAVAFRNKLPIFADMIREKAGTGSRFGQRVYGEAGLRRQDPGAASGLTPPQTAPMATTAAAQFPLAPGSGSAAAQFSSTPLAAFAATQNQSVHGAKSATAQILPSPLAASAAAQIPSTLGAKSATATADLPGDRFSLTIAPASGDILNVWAISLARFVWQPMLVQAMRATL